MKDRVFCPKALPDDIVVVFNYRNGDWEMGKVSNVVANVDRHSVKFGYTVILDRKSKAGNSVALHVVDNQIYQAK